MYTQKHESPEHKQNGLAFALQESGGSGSTSGQLAAKMGVDIRINNAVSVFICQNSLSIGV